MKTLLSTAGLALGLAFAAPAGASQWGCEVMLCLASPDDPMQYAACRPPMERYYKELASHDPDLPSCPEAGGGSRSAIQQAFYEHLYGDTRIAGYELRPGGPFGGQQRVPVNADGEELVCHFNQCRLADETLRQGPLFGR